jgi:hypothetical protein
MYPPPPPTTGEDIYTYLLDGHGSSIAGTTGGKSTIAANAIVLDAMGLRRKFERAFLHAKSATFDDLPGSKSTLEECLYSMRNLPSGKKFNPYWVVLVDYYFGRQSTRDWLQIITGE